MLIGNQKKAWRLLLKAVFLWALYSLVCTAAQADQLHLKNGQLIEADEVWEVGDELWFRQGKIVSSVAKSRLLRLVRATAAEGATRAGMMGERAPDGQGDRRRLTRVILKDGVTIEADEVWESAGQVVYRLGNVQTFIEREAVERVIPGFAFEEQPGVPKSSLLFATGQPGLDQLITESAAKHGLDPLLVYLVMREESAFNPRARSQAGARGLMQLMPATARRLGVRRLHDPRENVEAGTRYLKSLIELYRGDVNLALAAYNAGEEAVARYGRRVPPYRETRNYVRRINAAYRRVRSVGF